MPGFDVAFEDRDYGEGVEPVIVVKRGSTIFIRIQTSKGASIYDLSIVRRGIADTSGIQVGDRIDSMPTGALSDCTALNRSEEGGNVSCVSLYYPSISYKFLFPPSKQYSLLEKDGVPPIEGSTVAEIRWLPQLSP
jgi:hypothetical protein